MIIFQKLTFFLILFSFIFSDVKKNDSDTSISHESYYSNDRNFSTRNGSIGQYGFPSNPMNDRAKGYLLNGVVKNAITNYGNFITWDEHPAGLWGEYSYLPNVSMIAGVPGNKYSYKYSWYQVSSADIASMPSEFASTPSNWDEELATGYCEEMGLCNWESDQIAVFCSEDAYEAWSPNEDGSGGEFVDIVFDAKDDRGNLGDKIESELTLDHFAFNAADQWAMVRNNTPSLICISVEYNQYEVDNPNKSNSLIGLVYPWAKRPAFVDRLDEFDLYDYGENQQVWDEDDNYAYYGANVAESWFSRYSPSTNVDWHATNKARQNTHNTEVSAGDLFGDTPFSDAGDTYPLLAHSAYSNTWPETFNVETGEFEVFWPGWYAQDWDCEETGCSPCTKKNDACWVEVDGRFISDNDVYMEFDDRWAHRGNQLSSTNEYEQTGYPMGLKVKAIAHSYGVSYAEDIMFVTVKVKNESDDMVMPDGTKLNDGAGFNYRDISFGFYMDADVLSTDLFGNFNVHTNGDDFMEYYYDVVEIPSSEGDGSTERMLISMALIGDYDGISGGGVAGYSMDESDQDPGSDFGIVAVQLLDSPLATENLDFNNDGIIEVYEGEKMKMTDWHWFDWYNRPGVVYREGSGACCAGDPGKSQALNKEEIQYKIMVGDTTNLSIDEKAWYFHANPELDEFDPNFNPHFDSVDDLKQTTFFTDDEEGLDCVLEMTSGPFNLDVGDETLFSFCIIFGQNKEDLIANAEFAQIMYNNKYQGYTPPERPEVTSSYNHGQISLHWNGDAEFGKDVVTGYSDFEGYKIYKSTDGGVTWGGPEDKIFDDSGIHVGWRPLAQYDLTENEDLNYCVSIDYIDTNGDIVCKDIEGSTLRNLDISGPDPLAPWFHLGYNTGFDTQEEYTDSNTNGKWDSGEEFVDRNNNDRWDDKILTSEPYIDENGNSYKYTFVDNDVVDGVVYTYSITAYDMGVAPTYTVEWSEFETGFAQQQIPVEANPLGFSSPGGYQHVENSRGTTILDANFIQVTSGYTGDFSVNQVIVSPNPYTVHSGFNNETEYQRRIRFSKVPYDETSGLGATITIYTLTGEKVYSWNVADNIGAEPGDDGYNSWWDLRSLNNQEVAPGLYLYTVEFEGQSSVGKFAIVR